MSPELLQQRMDALERANKIRTRRAGLKRDLAVGKEDVRKLLADPPQYIKTMKVGDLILALPNIGKSKRNKILRTALEGRDQRIGLISEPRRQAVADLLP